MEWARGAVVGRGSSSTVSLALLSGRLLAAKSSPLSSSSPLQHEETVLSHLQGCPRIITAYGHRVTLDGGVHLYNLLLEFIPGGPLSGLCGSLSESAVRSHTKSILEGLSFVHGRGYVHCDVKPQNILVSGDHSDVKIADFGLSKRRFEDSSSIGGGTPLYMSPESVARMEYEAPMDIWALGCTVAEMVTGKPAWRNVGDDVWGLMMRIAFGADEDSPEIPEEVSDEGKDFLAKCWARDPERRWTADMLLKHPFVAGVGTAAGEVKQGKMSPRSVFGFSTCDDVDVDADDDSDESSLSSSNSRGCCSELNVRIASLATESRSNWPECEACDGWISVRGYYY